MKQEQKVFIREILHVRVPPRFFVPRVCITVTEAQ